MRWVRYLQTSGGVRPDLGWCRAGRRGADGVVLLVEVFTMHLPYGFSSIKLLGVTETGAKFGPVGYEVILL